MALERALEESSLPEGGSEEGGKGLRTWTPESEGLGTGPRLTPWPSVAHISFLGLSLLACEVGLLGDTQVEPQATHCCPWPGRPL